MNKTINKTFGNKNFHVDYEEIKFLFGNNTNLIFVGTQNWLIIY
jgi:hypothetical protein